MRSRHKSSDQEDDKDKRKKDSRRSVGFVTGGGGMAGAVGGFVFNFYSYFVLQLSFCLLCRVALLLPLDKDNKKERRASIRDAFSDKDKDKEDRHRAPTRKSVNITLSSSPSGSLSGTTSANATPDRSEESSQGSQGVKDEAQPDGGARRMLKRSLSVSNKGRNKLIPTDGVPSKTSAATTASAGIIFLIVHVPFLFVL
jgi:hypothetical protein